MLSGELILFSRYSKLFTVPEVFQLQTMFTGAQLKRKFEASCDLTRSFHRCLRFLLNWIHVSRFELFLKSHSSHRQLSESEIQMVNLPPVVILIKIIAGIIHKIKRRGWEIVIKNENVIEKVFREEKSLALSSDDFFLPFELKLFFLAKLEWGYHIKREERARFCRWTWSTATTLQGFESLVSLPLGWQPSNRFSAHILHHRGIKSSDKCFNFFSPASSTIDWN